MDLLLRVAESAIGRFFCIDNFINYNKIIGVMYENKSKVFIFSGCTAY